MAPRGHAVNRDFARWRETWQPIGGVYRVVRDSLMHAGQTKVSFEGVKINYGKWETGNSNDTSEYALDCHAHLHLLLSRAAIEALWNDEGCKCLRGRIEDSDDYIEEDCRDLEQFRLISLEHRLLEQDVQELKGDVKAILQLLRQLKQNQG